MLYAINKGAVEGYEEGQEPVIHLVARLDDIRQAGLPFVFSDGHGIVAYTQFFDNLARLDQVDFPLMTQTFWNDVNTDPNRSWRRQAEFLVHKRFPWAHVLGIGVLSEAMQSRVSTILEAHGINCPVAVRRNWYY